MRPAVLPEVIDVMIKWQLNWLSRVTRRRVLRRAQTSRYRAAGHRGQHSIDLSLGVWARRFDLIIIDECHLLPPGGEGMYQSFLAEARVINPLVRLIGLTATPFRMDSGLICGPDKLLSDICFEAGIRELIRDNYLCPLISKAGQQKADLSELHIRRGEFIASEVDAAMDQDDLVRAACTEIVEATRNRQAVLIFASGIEHGAHICTVLSRDHDIHCGFVCGDTPSAKRVELLARFRGEQSTDCSSGSHSSTSAMSAC